MKGIRTILAFTTVILIAAATSAFGQTYLINEDFEGGIFPPLGWQTSGVEWSTYTSRSPIHSVKIDAANDSISTPLLSSPRKLEFYAWYNVVGAMVRINYSTDGSNWIFINKHTASPQWWGQGMPISLTTLPEPLYLQFIWDEYNDPGATIYIDNVTVTETARANPSSNLVFQSGDYNGDGLTDIAIFRPSTGLWAVRGLGRVYFGADGDRPASGDYDGDGITDIAIYRPTTGLWAIKNVTRVYYGAGNDISVPGDYDGDGSCDIAVFDLDTGVWNLRGITTVHYGIIDDVPVPGDYNGNGIDDLGIFRPPTGLWAIRDITRAYFGGVDDIPVQGDYQWYAGGKGSLPFRNQMAIFRPASGLWAIKSMSRFYFGAGGDTPVAGNYGGSELDESGVFRSSNGLWAVKEITRVYFGTGGDIPLAK